MVTPCSYVNWCLGYAVLILALFYAHLAASQQVQQDDGKLLFAHLVFRHGDRTPIEPYPNDPWKDPSHWTTGWGQLTNEGKQRHLELGRWLRKRYAEFLPELFSVNDVYVRSTDVDRTLMSVESNLAGLYPPVSKDIWDSAIQWQPIPVHTVPEYLDPVLSAKMSCPAFDRALKKYKKSPEFVAYNKSLEPLYNYLAANTGRKIDSPTSVQNLYSTLHIEELNNFTLPDWTHPVYPEPLRSVSARTFATKTNTSEMARLKTGPLIKEILERFRDKLQKKLIPNRKLWVYSAHDTTVANVLNSLHLFDLHNPPFAACVLIELRQPVLGEPYVSVYYKNSTAEPKPMSIPKCGTRCPLDKMFEVYADILPQDWARECEVSLLSLTYVEAEIRSKTSVIYLIFLSLLGMVAILMALVSYRRRQGSYHNEKWYLRIDG